MNNHSPKQVYLNMRIRYKLFLLVLLIMGCSFAVTYPALRYVFTVYDQQLYSTSSKLLNLSSNLIESEVKKVSSISFNIATDPDIQNGLRRLTNNSVTDYEKLGIRSSIVSGIVKYAGNQPYLYSAEVVAMNNEVFIAGSNVNRAPEELQQLIRIATEGAGEGIWVYPNRADSSLTLVKQIRSYEDSNIGLEPIGFLIFRIRMNDIVSNSLVGTGMRDGELVISSSDGNKIYPEGGEGISAGAASSLRFGSNSSYEIKQISGNRYFVTYSISPVSGWVYHNVFPYDPIFNRIIWMKRMLLILFSASVVIVVGLALSFARSITKPIEALMSKMKRVQNGQFQVLLSEETGSRNELMPMDEVGQLQRTFRMMIQQIDELITENYKKQLTIKETQFQALQAQINPHFLYNTLDSINWLAKVNRQEAISQMVEALGYLFRHSISLSDRLVTIENELSIALHYVTIQRYRFQDRLLFEAEIPEEYFSRPIPKLTLQPLLENAIYYGLEPLIEPCRITIRAYEEEGKLVVAVEDEGQGMDPARLEQIRRGDYASTGRSIGLNNINERIKLAFGDEYGVRIDSARGKGTVVRVYLPL